MKSLRNAFIVHKKYGKMKSFVYYPLHECDNINLEPLTIRRMMKQIQVELFKPVEFHGMFGLKMYPPGIHSLDSDLAKLLVRVRAARVLLPHTEVPAPTASRS